MRKSEIRRTTAETDILLSIDLDGIGVSSVDTGVPFLNHMLTLFAKHGSFDLSLVCKGDTDVDAHHSTEDIGIALGQAFREALGDKRGIVRYGDILLPMDEALILSALDISGRGMLCWEAAIPAQKVGEFDTELTEEFFRALAVNAGFTLHIRQLAGNNSHHIIEGMFKASARTIRKAVAIDAGHRDEIPSTKGSLSI